MATNADVIKEFLVALGVKIDEAGFKKFDGVIAQTTRHAATLGAVVLATAASIEAFVTKVAHQMEALYYVSQRTGSAVENLQAFEYAAQQIGLSADDARGAVEGLAMAMKTDPGKIGLLNALGIKTQGRDAMSILNDLTARLKKMPTWLAVQYGQELGINPTTLIQMMNNWGQVTKASAQYRRELKAAGIDSKKLATDSKDFANELRTLEGLIDIVGQQIEKRFLPSSKTMIRYMEEGVKWFIKLDTATNGWSTTLSTVGVTALGAWIAKAVLIGPIIKAMASDLTSTAKFFLGIATSMTAIVAAITALTAYGFYKVATDDKYRTTVGEGQLDTERMEAESGGQILSFAWDKLSALMPKSDNLTPSMEGPFVFGPHPPAAQSGGIIINQTNNISLPAGSSTTAMENTLNRTNGDLVRNLGGAVR